MRRINTLLVAHLLGCAGMLNGVSVDRRAQLEQTGFQVHELRGGWVRLIAPEGYSFVMPSTPSFEEERFQFAGVSIPQRYFDLSTEQNSRAFLVRVFDARELDAAARDALRNQATQLFRPDGSNIQSQGRIHHHGVDVEVTMMGGFGTTGRHTGILHSFQEDGFVWFLMTIYEDGYGGPGHAEEFFSRVF